MTGVFLKKSPVHWEGWSGAFPHVQGLSGFPDEEDDAAEVLPKLHDGTSAEGLYWPL